MESEKYCPDCGRSRPVSTFTRDKRRRDGLAFYRRNHSRQRLRESKARRSGPPQSRHKLDELVPEGSDWCPDSDRVKPFADFSTARSNKSGRHTYCNGGLGQFKIDPQLLHAAAYYVAFHTAQQEIAAELAAKAQSSAASARPGTPPVGSHRRPGARGTTTRSTRRSSGARRRTQAGEADT